MEFRRNKTKRIVQRNKRTEIVVAHVMLFTIVAF